MRRPYLLAVAFVALLLPSVSFSSQLYRVALADGRPLAAAIGRGVVVRHVGTREAIVAGDAGTGAALRRAGLACDDVARTGDWPFLYLCYAGRDANLASYGTVLWSEPGGAALVGASADAVEALRAACFMAYPLPAAVDAAGWLDDAPPRHVAEAAARGEPGVRGLVQDVMDAVSADSLVAHVGRLSQYPDGSLRTRYVRRSECLTEARAYLEGGLGGVLPAGAPVDTQRFTIQGYTCEEGPDGPTVDYPADNVIGVLEGDGTLGGCYVVCAHYDATAQRSFRDGYYWWCDSPAPGADDNATGVAAALEVARALSGVTLPFDVRFALFSGEELGLLGSGVYADSVAAAGDTVYGVLDVDMIGYKLAPGNPDTCHLVTNPGSKWLADWLVGTVEEYPAEFGNASVLRVDQSLAYSDHASFWRNGYDGIVAIEHWRPADRNPTYHTLSDTLENVSASQAALAAKVVAGSIARLADPDGHINLAVFPEDVEYDPDDLAVGAIAQLSVDVHAFGPIELVDATIEVWDGEADEGALLSQLSVSDQLGGGGVIRHRFGWAPGEGDVGEHTLTARVLAPGTDELTLTDNQASVTVSVVAPTLYVLDHYPYPNPVPSADDLAFSYELSRDAESAVVRVFDLTGQELRFRRTVRDVSAGAEGNEGVLAGWNTVTWASLGGPASDLASGVYVYTLEVYAEGSAEADDVETGKFAVLR